MYAGHASARHRWKPPGGVDQPLDQVLRRYCDDCDDGFDDNYGSGDCDLGGPTT